MFGLGKADPLEELADAAATTTEERERAELAAACEALVQTDGPTARVADDPAPRVDHTAGAASSDGLDEVARLLDDAGSDSDRYRTELAELERQLAEAKEELESLRSQAVLTIPPVADDRAEELDALRAQLADAQARLDEAEMVRTELQETRAQVDALTADHERLLRELADAAQSARSEADAGAEAGAAHANLIGEAEATVAALRTELADAQRSSTESATEADRLSEQLREAQTRNDELTAERDRLSEELAASGSLRQELQDAHARVEESQAAFEAVSLELVEVRGQVDALAAEHQRLTDAESENFQLMLNDQRSTYEDELARAVREYAEAQSRIAALEQALREQRAEFEAELAQAGQRETRLRLTADEVSAALISCRAEVASLQERLLASEQQRAEEAATLLSVLEREARGAPSTRELLD